VFANGTKFLKNLHNLAQWKERDKEHSKALQSQLDQVEGDNPEEDARSPFQKKCLAFVEHWSFELLMMILTIYALFGADLNQLVGNKDIDIPFGWFSLFVMVLFFLEVVITSLGKLGYFLGAYFWLDMLAAISLLGDVPFIATELIGNSFAAARAGRASKAGTRAARVVRVIRLIRLTRLVKFMQNMRGGEKKEEEEDQMLDSEQRASAISNKLSELTTAKIIIGLLLMLFAMIWLTPYDDDLTWDQALSQLKNQTDGYAEYGLEYDLDEATVAELQKQAALDFVVTYTNEDIAISARGDCAIDGCCKSSPNIFKFYYAGTEFDMTCANSTDGGPEIVIPAEDTLSSRRRTETQLYGASGFETFFNLTIDEKEIRDNEAIMSSISTSFIIVMLVLMMISFQASYGKINIDVVDPLVTLTAEMNMVSYLEFKETKMIPSEVLEVRAIQKTFLTMKNSLMSFALFAPRDVVVDMLSSGKEAGLCVNAQDVTVFFSHIDNFEALNENTSSKKDLLLMLSKYFDVVADAIAETEGTLLDFIGDMVLAIWNAPHPVAFHSAKALEACILMQEHINESPALLDHNGEAIFEVSCGVNCGLSFVGNIGASVRMKYTVIGDPVNLASRVGGLNSRYDTFCVVTEAMYHSPTVCDKFLLANLDCVTVKGKSVGVRVYELVARKESATLSQCQLCDFQNEAMAFYYSREFKEAISKFEELLKVDPENVAASVLMKRCKKFVENPPPADWDGAEKMMSKHFH